MNPLSLLRTREVDLFGNPTSQAQSLVTERTTYMLSGEFNDPTQAQREGFNTLMDGEVGILDLYTERGIYEWVKILNHSWRTDERSGNMWSYTVELKTITPIGFMEMLTADAGFHDYGYYKAVNKLDPFRSYCTLTLASLLTHQHELYVANWKNAIQTLEFSITCGNDVSKIELWGWKSSAWSSIGTWGSGGADWGNTAAWTDEDSEAHTLRANYDVRGANVANFTKNVSRSLGPKYRVVIQISNMTAYDVADALTTQYGKQQLLLRLKLTHTQRESARPYPIVTYVDGGYSLGVA